MRSAVLCFDFIEGLGLIKGAIGSRLETRASYFLLQGLEVGVSQFFGLGLRPEELRGATSGGDDVELKDGRMSGGEGFRLGC